MAVGGSSWLVCLVFANNFMSGRFFESFPKNTTLGNSAAFVGAVVNFEPSWTKGSPKMAAVMSAASYGKFAQQAAANGAEVVVFPEGALRSSSGEPVPVDIPPLGSNMCDSVSFPDQLQIMSLLSCAAYSASLYLVAAVDENVDSEVCSCQVVFDSDGTLIARHREYKCADDEDDDQYFLLQPSGVKIGLLLTQDLVEFGIVDDLVSTGIVDFALSYNTKEAFPFGTSLQIQLWWSFGRNVILMASGLTTNAETDRRSGIYGGRSNGRCLPMEEDHGLVVAGVPNKTGTALDCRDVEWYAARSKPGPRRQLRALGEHKTAVNPSSPHNGLKSKNKTGAMTSKHSDYYYDHYGGNDYDYLENEKVTLKPVVHEMSGKWTRICQYEFCCSFYIETTHIDDHPGYRLMVFSGPSSEFGPNIRVDRCGLIQCHECEGNEVNTFMVQSNRPGLTPNVLTDGKSPSPRIRFSDTAHPKMIADHNVRSVVSAVLQTVEKEDPDDDADIVDAEDDPNPAEVNTKDTKRDPIPKMMLRSSSARATSHPETTD